jgi:hypothetical protein
LRQEFFAFLLDELSGQVEPGTTRYAFGHTGWHSTLNEYSFAICLVAIFIGLDYSKEKLRDPNFLFNGTKQEKSKRVLLSNLILTVFWVLFTARKEFQYYLDFEGIRGIYINSLLEAGMYFLLIGVVPLFTSPGKRKRDRSSIDSR